MTSDRSNPDELPSLSLSSCPQSEWDVLMAQTAREIRSRLDAWRAEDERIKAIFANLKRRQSTAKS
jgi:hypothetical protein